jgi:hypothetical protein
MRMRALLMVLSLALGLGACVTTQRADRTRDAEIAACIRKHETRQITTWVGRAQCINDADARHATATNYPYPDLDSLFAAYHVAVAERRDRGEMTGNEAFLKMTELTSRIAAEERRRNNEEDRRDLERRLTLAQIQSLRANQLSRLLQGLATFRANDSPTHTYLLPGGRMITCSQMGNFTNCY